MRIYEDNGNWKIGKNGDPVYKTRSEAKEVYITNKLSEIRNAWRKVINKKNGK